MTNQTKSMVRKTMEIFLSLLFLYLLVVLMTYIFQRNMMYFPQPFAINTTLSAVPDIQEINVETQDGLSLTAWYKPPAKDTKPVILFFHGNASHVAMVSPRAVPFVQDGYGVLLAEYRGYSGNPGKPTEEGLYNDGRAYLTWLETQGIARGRIILFGESLGTGVAVQIGIEHAGLRALVLEAPFTSTVAVAQKHYPFLPVAWLMKDRYESIDKIGKITMPLIVVHGTNDTVVPFEQGKALFAVAPDPKTFVTMEGAGHVDLGERGSSEKILSLLAE